MEGIAPKPMPAHALLARYAGDGGYADCYAADLPGQFSHAEFVAAFYTTWLFKLERALLKFLARRPSTDGEAQQLARGQRESFAAWTVEARAPNQLLLRDFIGNTRSWLMVESAPGGGATRLYFGSAIVPRVDPRSGTKKLGASFHVLLGFHKRYSRALLSAARTRLQLTCC